MLKSKHGIFKNQKNSYNYDIHYIFCVVSLYIICIFFNSTQDYRQHFVSWDFKLQKGSRPMRLHMTCMSTTPQPLSSLMELFFSLNSPAFTSPLFFYGFPRYLGCLRRRIRIRGKTGSIVR